MSADTAGVDLAGPHQASAPAAAASPLAAGGSEIHVPAGFWQRRLAYLALDVANRVIPKTPDRVVLHSAIDLEDGILSVAEELHARGWAPTLLLERRSRAGEIRRLTGGRLRTAPKRSLRGLVLFLTARFVMTTHNIYGNRKPPASQVVVNLWHGETPAGKVIAQLEPGQGPLHCTYATIGSKLGRAFRSAEFGLHPLRVLIVGAPRNDRMLRSDGAAVRRLLGEDTGRPVFLWLPTFRTMTLEGRTRRDVVQSHPGVPFPAADVKKLDDWLVEHDARVVLKLHPLDAAKFSGDFRAIRVLGQEEMQQHGLTVYTLLPAFDGLLTDLSSVWVDYLLLDKPIVFPFPDIQNYRDGRGLSIEPYEDWVSGPFAQDMDGLIEALGDLVAGRDPMARDRRLAQGRYHQYRDDRSAARLLDALGIDQSSGSQPLASEPPSHPES